MRWSTMAALLGVAFVVFSGCGGSGSHERVPDDRLIVLAQSMGGIQIGEPRRSVEKVLGGGKSTRAGLVSYFGGRLLVDYWVHDELQAWVGGLETRSSAFRTRSGLRVGSSRDDLRHLHVICDDSQCSLAARPDPLPDEPGTVFMMHRGKVAEIDIFYG